MGARLRLVMSAWLLATPLLVSAAAINKDIYACGEKVAHIDLNNPTVYASGSQGGVTESGAAIGYRPPLDTLCELRWVQLISTTDPLNTNAGANVPYFDPGELDPTRDSDPFYWNTTLKAADGKNYPGFWYKTYQVNGGETFYDQPKRTWTGPAISWTAELTLVLWKTGSTEFMPLWSGNYGFNISNTGIVTVSGVTELAAPVWLTDARLTQYFPGWTMEENCADCIIPEPSSVLLLSVGLMVLVGRRKLTTRRAA